MMTVDIDVNGRKIEEIKIRRLNVLKSEDQVSTYKVSYRRLMPHDTAKVYRPAFVFVKHKYSDGSLKLIELAIQEIQAQETKRTLP